MPNHHHVLIKVVMPLAIGAAVLISISILRKSNSRVLVDAATLGKTHISWTNRTFVECSNRHELQAVIESLMPKQSLDGLQRGAAIQFASGMIQAYAERDWSKFERVRIPLATFKVHDEVLAALAKYSDLSLQTSSPLEMYQSLWLHTFREKPLFTAVAFITNSVTVLSLDRFPTERIPFPDFVQRHEQNWLEVTPTGAFDYSGQIQGSSLEPRSFKLLKFFFFARCPEPEGARPFMLTAFWDESNQLWLPWALTHASVRPTTHALRFF